MTNWYTSDRDYKNFMIDKINSYKYLEPQ